MSKQVILPPRPYVPPLLYALFISIATMHICLVYLSWEVWFGFAALVLGLVVLLATVFVWKRVHTAALSVGICFLAAICSFYVAGVEKACMQQTTELLERYPVSNFNLLITRDSSLGETGYRSVARLKFHDQVLAQVWLVSDSAYTSGDKLLAVGRFKRNEDDSFGRTSSAQAIVGTIRVVHETDLTQATGPLMWLKSARNHLVQRIGASTSDGRALLAGIALGDREAIKERGLDEIFARAGVSHLVAVSGSHIALFSALVLTLLKTLQLKIKARTAIVLLASASFVLLCGAPVSALRAWLMVSVSYASEAVGRRSHALSALSCVALAMALLDPSVTGQLSYLLSVSSVVGLTLFGSYGSYAGKVLMPFPRIAYRAPWLISSGLQKLWYTCREIIVTSCVAQCFTFALTVSTFGQFSLVAILSNIAVTNFFSLALTSGIVALLLSCIPFIGQVALAITDCFTEATVAILSYLASLPLAAIPIDIPFMLSMVVTLLVIALLLIFWPRISPCYVFGSLAAIGLVCVCFFVRWRYFAPARFVVLNIGQGDALLIQEGAHAILVDTGPDTSLATELQALHVFHIDAVVLTHLHDDHIGGLPALAGVASVDKVYVAKGVSQHMPEETKQATLSLTHTEPSELTLGESLSCETFKLLCLWPKTEVTGLENAHSVQLRVDYSTEGDPRHFSLLLTGDAERDELEELLQTPGVAPIDVLKLGHHGSKVSLTKEQAKRLNVKLCVVSAGVHNSFGHPSQEVQNICSTLKIPLYATNEQGRIILEPSAQQILVSYERSL